MSRSRWGLRLLLASLWAAGIPPASVNAMPPPEHRGLYLPLDFSSGPAFGRGEPRPYAFRGRLCPLVGFGSAGRIRVGVEALAVYHNPAWFSGVGAAASLRVWGLPTEEIGVFLGVDHLWWQGNHPCSGVSLTFDPDGILRLGVRIDRDWQEESTVPQASLGFDLIRLARLMRGRQPGVHGLPSDHG